MNKIESMYSGNQVVAILRGLAGGVAGGAIGFFLFKWMWSEGFYSVILPGALLGLGCGWASRSRSVALGVVCAIAAVVFGFWSEWMVRPFLKDDSLQFFLKNMGDLSIVTYLMIGFGALMAFWFGRGR